MPKMGIHIVKTVPHLAHKLDGLEQPRETEQRQREGPIQMLEGQQMGERRSTVNALEGIWKSNSKYVSFGTDAIPN